MATKLKNMRLTSVDLVKSGANQKADICLFKSAEEEQPDPENIYKSAIIESIQSIVTDDTLTKSDKNAMIEQSIEQYHEAMVDLFAVGKSAYDNLNHLDLEKELDYDEIEVIQEL